MNLQNHLSLKRVAIITLLVFTFISCKKPVDVNSNLKQTNTYSSEVVSKWLDLQNQILLQPQDINPGFENFIPRFYSAVGIAIYESVVPGMQGYQSLSGQLVEMPAMPAILQDKEYHWAASANASIATIFRSFFPVKNQSLTNSLTKIKQKHFLQR